MDNRGDGIAMVQRYGKAEVPRTSSPFFISFTETNFTDVRRVIVYRCLSCNRLYHYAQDVVIMSKYPEYSQKLILIAMIFMAVIILLTLFLSAL